MSDDTRPTEPFRQTPPAQPAAVGGTPQGSSVPAGGWNAADPFAPASAAPNAGAAFGPSAPTPAPVGSSRSWRPRYPWCSRPCRR